MHLSRTHQKGSSYWIVGVAALVGLTAMATDVGYMVAAKSKLQAAVDAAAHGGALMLAPTEDGVATATATAKRLVTQNPIFGHSVTVDGIQTGTLNASTGEFTPTEDVSKVNALRVDASIPELDFFFAPAVGMRKSVGLAAGAAGNQRFVAGAATTPCYLPLAVPSCMFDGWDASDEETGDKFRSFDLVLNPAGPDTAGWAASRITPTPTSSRTRSRAARATGRPPSATRSGW